MTTEKSNKLIAEFMGYKLSEDGYYLLPLDLPQFINSDHGEWCSQYEVSFAERYWEISETALDYNVSWDWLIPVIGELSRRGMDRVWQKCILAAVLEDNVEGAFEIVVEIIKNK